MVYTTPRNPIPRTGGTPAMATPAPTSFAGSVNAPDFPDGIEWLNTNRPLAMADLRGKILILDFWTYC